MLKRIGVALTVIALVLPFEGMAQKGGRSSWRDRKKTHLRRFERLAYHKTEPKDR